MSGVSERAQAEDKDGVITEQGKGHLWASVFSPAANKGRESLISLYY